jgi:hypothetical protein
MDSLNPAMGRRGFLAASAGMAAAVTMPPALRPRPAAANPEDCARLEAIVRVWDTAVRPMMASRYHRLHHCMFHYTRNSWANFTPEQQAQIRALGWAPPRPAMELGNWERSRPNQSLYWATTNGSGEDFLYFHRWMIAMVDAQLKAAGTGPLEAWSGTDSIPQPAGGCGDEGVPDFTPMFANPDKPLSPTLIPSLQQRVRDVKESGFFWNRLNWWQQEFRDRASLRDTALGELGSRLEGGVHNQMHIRWSAYPTNGYRLIRDESDFRPVWDDPGYDTLFDEYGSHVGPIFFRLHKWIDNRIEDWAEAQGSNVERYTTPYGFDWFRPGPKVKESQLWTGAWGFEPVSPDEERRRVGIMEQVTRAMFPPPALKARLEAVGQEREVEEERIMSIRDMPF